MQKEKTWMFELYIAGMTPHAITTLSNLKNFCKKFIVFEYEIVVIDLITQPHLAFEKQIFAIPTLIRINPLPICRSIGDLSDIDSLRLQFNIEGHEI